MKDATQKRTVISVCRQGSQHGNSEGIVRMEGATVRSDGLASLGDYVEEDFSGKTNCVGLLHMGRKYILGVKMGGWEEPKNDKLRLMRFSSITLVAAAFENGVNKRISLDGVNDSDGGI